MTNLKQWLPILLILLWLPILYLVMVKPHSQAFRFVDEEEHMAVGYLISQGYRLYRDVSPNHQPLNYLFSAMVHQTTPDNFFMLLWRHRQAVFIWSGVWLILLAFKYRLKILPLLLGFETIKYFILGNEFLAESLAVYPLIYLFGSVVDDWQRGHHRDKSPSWLFGMAAVITVYLLIYLAPLVTILTLIKWLRLDSKRRISMLLGMALVGMSVLGLVDGWGYFRDTVINNYRYQIPELTPFKGVLDYLKLLGLPWLTAISPENLLGVWIAVSTWISSFATLFLIHQRELTWKQGGALWWLLALANNRQLSAQIYYYQGFHLLPWLGLLIFMTGYLIDLSLKNLSKKIKIGLLVFGVMVTFGLSVQPGSLWLKESDPATDNYIQYTPLYQISQEIKLKTGSEEDRLMVMPINSILHWSTGLKPATKQITFYHWQYQVPEQRADYETVMRDNPPKFIVYTTDNSAYTEGIEIILSQNYQLVYGQNETMALYEREQTEK